MPLIIVPTPIGNLEDITLRALRVLREADVIACEDTRHTLKLLNHFDIKKPLISCHEHNEAERAETIIKKIEEGQTVALVSDAGTPGLSDPGWLVIKAVSELNLPYDVLPGANALLPALLLSAMDMSSFYFVGFLKGKTEEKKKRLREIAGIRDTLVFYVSPHHLFDELALAGGVLGDRDAVLVREISKIHQETIRGTLLTLADIIPKENVRGEFVCVVKGCECCNEIDVSLWTSEAFEMQSQGKTLKDIAEFMYSKYGVSKNEIKRYLLDNLKKI